MTHDQKFDKILKYRIIYKLNFDALKPKDACVSWAQTSRTVTPRTILVTIPMMIRRMSIPIQITFAMHINVDNNQPNINAPKCDWITNGAWVCPFEICIATHIVNLPIVYHKLCNCLCVFKWIFQKAAMQFQPHSTMNVYVLLIPNILLANFMFG